MISNQVLQSTLEGLKEISRVDLCVVDTEGILLASTFEGADRFRDAALSFAASPADSQVISGFQFFKILDESQPEYVLIAGGGTGEDVYMVGKMAAFHLQNLLVDIYNRAKKLHIDADCRRAVFILELENERENSCIETVRSLFTGRPGDFITAVDEKSIIIVREVGETEGYEQLDTLAGAVLDVLPEDRRKDALIAYGTIVGEIKDVSRSYKEARMALDVGKIFFEENRIIAYSSLGIGRLIYQLPIPLCRMFIKEIFETKSPDDFDDETLVTINKFFDNNLNVSETSRQLYIHRNTLVYRLDKLQKSTGLDLRVFEDAITFKIALMVVKYMRYMEMQEY